MGVGLLDLSPDTRPLSRHTSVVKRNPAISSDEVIERLNEVVDQIGDEIDDDLAFLSAAARRLLRNVEWDSSPEEDCTPPWP
jgi:hypothetical protein